jgi:hypothetical protein
LFVPMTPVGPRLIQPRSTRRPHAAALVRDRAAAIVEWDAGQLDAAIADAAKDEAALERLRDVGRDGSFVLVEDVADELDPLDSVVAEDRDRRLEELEDDAPRLSLRLARGKLVEDSEVSLRVRVFRFRALEVGRINDHVSACELAHLLQLRES